jgi:FkbM family methyltransferase
MKISARPLFRSFGYDLVRVRTPLDTLFRQLRIIRDQGQVDNRAALDFASFCARNLHSSRSQLLQDLFVLFLLGERRGGYFVEFGASDGITLSNTWLLEHNYGWTGVLAEPGRCWHEALKTNRRAAVDLRCVWSKSGTQLQFNEARIAEFSTIDSLSGQDVHASKRQRGACYMVETVSLNDLLAQHQAPNTIDYLSIDTEGSEFDILSSFDFGTYDVRVITVEHNHVQRQRNQLFDLLSARGYDRVFTECSDLDDWYVKSART